MTRFSLLIFFTLITPCLGQQTTEAPQGIENVGITDRSGEMLPLETPFVDSAGRRVILRQLFDGERPVILTFHYADCPMLCRLQRNGLVDVLRQIELDAGDEFRVVSISIDPSETPQQSAVLRQHQLQAYGRRMADDGWSFLTGPADSVQAVTSAAGFDYRYLPEQREFSHAAAVMLCSPDGRLTRYLYGVKFDPQTVQLSLNEAASGQIGSPLDKLLLFCFRYDAATGRYTPAAWNLMRAGAITTALLLGVFVLRSRRNTAPGSRSSGSVQPS